MVLWRVTIRGKDAGGEYEYSLDVEDMTAEAARKTAEESVEPGERPIRVVRAPKTNIRKFRRKK